MNLMMKIIEDLTPLNRVFCSDDYDRSIEYLGRLLPFKVIEYKASEEHNGWVIAPRWNVVEARIMHNGKVIYDGMKNALAVIALSKSFRGRVGLEELKKHLHYDHRYKDAIPYHFRQLYRPWERDWGFCVPKRFYDSLEPGEYEVVIQTEESEGSLKILDYTHEGKSKEEFVFAAHLDHPGMANDGLSGCAVGVELMRRLSKKKTKYTYKLLLHQEVIGSEYYLAKAKPDDRNRIMEGIFLEMLGSNTQLALQASQDGQSNIEYCLEESLKESGVSFRKGPYGTIVVNGEYIWEAYGIPMASLSRYPYPEYHTDRDIMSIISEEVLEEAVGILERSTIILEESYMIYKKFKGNLCLSNPRYDLYVDPGQAAFGGFDQRENIKKLRYLMELIPMLHKPMSLRLLSKRVGLPEETVLNYLHKWTDKGLIENL